MLYGSLEKARKEYEKFLKSLNSGGAIHSDSARMDYIKREVEDICSVAGEYRDKYSELMKDTSSNSQKTLYGSKSVIPRGFYNPSPIIDNVLKDFNRGHLIGEAPDENGEYFKFILGKDGSLLRSEFYNDMPIKPYNTEFIIRKGDCEYGITFNNAWGKINYLCKTKFKNGLVQSTMAFCCNDICDSHSPNSIMDVDSYEEYYYFAGKIIGACVYVISAVSYYYTMKEYSFFYNDSGEMENRYTCRYVEGKEFVVEEHLINPDN